MSTTGWARRRLGAGGVVGRWAATAALGAALVAATGCSSDGGGAGADGFEVPTTYTFESRFVPGKSSVSYGGQIDRQALIAALTAEVGSLTARVDKGDDFKAGDVQGALEFFYAFDASVGGALAHGLAITPEPVQKTWAELGGKDLVGKIAGNDAVGQHRDWDKEGVIGWPGSPGPDALVRSWFAQLDVLVQQRAGGTVGVGADGKPLAEVYVTAAGHDLKELLQKFLLGAVNYSQGADDYLDDDTDGKGLREDHTKADGDGAPFTALEHAWDEGFGYFGAARDYAGYSDEELAGKGGDAVRRKGVFDSDGDGKIDLFAEANFGHALNCSKRDFGAVGKADIDLSGAAFSAFLRGRARIAATPLGGADDAMRAALAKDRDEALAAWEACIAATVVHYINEALADAAIAGEAGWSHRDAAKHWSELKGFALALQFSRHAMLDKAQIAELHAKIGDGPVLGDAGAEAIAKARADLLAARALVMGAYGFPEALAGDDAGAGGW